MGDADKIEADLRAARELVDRADLPSDLRAVGFAATFQRLAAGAGTESPGTPAAAGVAPVSVNPSAARPSGASAEADEPLAVLARRLGVGPTALERIVDIDEDGVHLLLQRPTLERSKRPATRQLAILSIALRQGARLEEWTPLAELRALCQRFGVYSQNHFSEDVRALPGIRLRGSGGKAEAKATVATFEAAGELVRSLVGVPSSGGEPEFRP